MKDRPNFKKKTYAWMPRNRLLLDLMSSPVGVLGINWAFQGMLGMDRTDRWFKLGLDAIITFGVAGLLIPFVSPWAAFAGAFLLAHTSNWLFNTHFFVIGRFVGFTATPVERIPAYTRGVGERVAYSPAILAAAVYGAVSRGAGVRTTSDVDVRFIRRPGWGNGLRAACFTFTEARPRLLRRFSFGSVSLGRFAPSGGDAPGRKADPTLRPRWAIAALLCRKGI